MEDFWKKNVVLNSIAIQTLVSRLVLIAIYIYEIPWFENLVCY